MANLEKIKASIVITHYNKKGKLLCALNSLTNQVSKEFEVIVVDDSSSDRESKDVFLFAQSKNWPFEINFYYNDKNYGASFTKNRGVSLSRSDLIILLDADDTLPEHAVKDIIRVAERNPEYDFYFGDYFNGKELVDCSKVISEKSELSPRKLCRNWLLLGSSPFRKSKWVITGGFDEKNPKSDDYEFYKKWLYGGAKGLYINSVIYNWEPDSDGNQASNSKADRARAFLRTCFFDFKYSKLHFLYRFIKSVIVLTKEKHNDT